MKQCNFLPLHCSSHQAIPVMQHHRDTGKSWNLCVERTHQAQSLKCNALPEIYCIVSFVLKRLDRYCMWASSWWVLCVLNIPSTEKAQVILGSWSEQKDSKISKESLPPTGTDPSLWQLGAPTEVAFQQPWHSNHSNFIKLVIFNNRFSSSTMPCVCMQTS